MSIYCHLSCRECKETLFVKDSDSEVHANSKEHGEFLEKHCHHILIYTWEDDEIGDRDGWIVPVEWQRFKLSEDGWWSHGTFYFDEVGLGSVPRSDMQEAEIIKIRASK